MDYNYSDLIVKAKLWGEDALQNGWIKETDFQVLTSIDERTPNSLFSMGSHRPLIVAFFGGTGVGKSSLINRLAGAEIARTGVERPTSREVTLFHHQDVVLQNLPEKLPVDKIKLISHHDENRKHVVWIDMPDMDSTEQKNKQLVLEWLPHIDVLVYVVSPERYRDNKAWRLLLAEGGRYAWVFVLNQWDRGAPEQYDDFIHQLGKAGFDNPIVLRTVGEPVLGAGIQDDFTKLEETIQQLTDANTIQQLELRGIQIRKDEVKQMLDSSLKTLGQDASYEEVAEVWTRCWQETSEVLNEGLGWPLQRLAVYYVKHEYSLLASITHKQDGAESRQGKITLWDDWAQNRYDDVLNDLVLKADQCNIPVTPLRQALIPVREQAAKRIQTQVELAVRQALANPGNGLQRFLFKFAGFCKTLLPMAAMVWVGYQVYYEFYESSLLEEPYLGSNFAIHSVLMIAISWALPFFLQKQLKPSLEKVALKGLKRGLQAGFAVIETEVEAVIEEVRNQREQYAERLQDIIRQCDDVPAGRDSTQNETLSRMLVEK